MLSGLPIDSALNLLQILTRSGTAMRPLCTPGPVTRTRGTGRSPDCLTVAIRVPSPGLIIRLFPGWKQHRADTVGGDLGGIPVLRSGEYRLSRPPC